MDALTQLDAIIPALQQLAAETSLGQLDAGTPCDEWQVRDLLGHLIVSGTIAAAAVRGEEPPAEIPVGPDEILTATAKAALADIDEAFRRPAALERMVRTTFGPMPGVTFARFLAYEGLMHSWDLATATGRSVDVPDDVVTAIEAFARAITPDLRGPGTFGSEREPAEGASPLECLAAFSGRRTP